MRAILALTALLAVATAVHVCLPGEFIVDQVTFEPEKHDVFAAKVYFSERLQAERIDVNFIDVNSQVVQERVSLVSNFKTGKQYSINYNLTDNTATCKVSAISGTLERPCLSKNARHRGEVTLGAVLHCNNYVEMVQDNQGQRVLVDALVAKDIEVPIRVFDRRHDGKESVTEFWNFKETVNTDHFHPPAVCNNAVEGPVYQISSVHKMAKYSPLVRKF